jgi:hypothetical protein
MVKEDNLMAPIQNEAVGTSDNLSFDEALRAALKKLHHSNEQPLTIKLEEIIYQPGDLAGKHHLSVRISGAGVG